MDVCLQAGTARRHLLDAVATYEALAKAKADATKSEIEAAVTALTTLIAGPTTNPAWCGIFCTTHASDIVGSGQYKVTDN